MRHLKLLNLLYFTTIRSELNSGERLLAPLIFAMVMLLLFALSFAAVDHEMQGVVLIAQTYLTVFFALQISFSRAFEPDVEDGALDLMRSYPVSPLVIYIAKCLIVYTMGLMLLLPTVAMALFLNSAMSIDFWEWELLVVPLTAMIGLVAIGVMLAFITLAAKASQLLYPIIYFPLTIPVLVGAIEATKALSTNGGNLAEVLGSWLGLLLIFDLVYVTLGLVLFDELIKSE